MESERLLEALNEYHRFNRLKNDLDAYLYALGEWALNGGKKPNSEDYGVEAAITLSI